MTIFHVNKNKLTFIDSVPIVCFSWFSGLLRRNYKRKYV